MIYVNSETILKIDRFSLLRYERVIHIWDILFLTITYMKHSSYIFIVPKTVLGTLSSFPFGIQDSMSLV